VAIAWDRRLAAISSHQTYPPATDSTIEKPIEKKNRKRLGKKKQNKTNKRKKKKKKKNERSKTKATPISSNSRE
jgi:hypothetical protein